MKYRVWQVTVNDDGRSRVALKRIPSDDRSEETFGDNVAFFSRNGAYWYLQLGKEVEFSIEVTGK